jgi:hypothetical protein
MNGNKKEKKISREEFERAFNRLAELYADFNSLFIRFINTGDEGLREKLQEWVIKNHKEVELRSKIIEDY